MLVSPFFYYRIDLPQASDGTTPLSNYALASRLSYFLWSSLPDEQLLAHAAAGDLHRPDVLIAFGLRAQRQMQRLEDLVVDINDREEAVYIYGASTRGGTIWQTAGLDFRLLPYAVERNPEKVGKKIASIGTRIISEEEARRHPPEYMLVSPWFFRDEFVERERDYLARGGKFIFPLPELEVVGG